MFFLYYLLALLPYPILPAIHRKHANFRDVGIFIYFDFACTPAGPWHAASPPWLFDECTSNIWGYNTQVLRAWHVRGDDQCSLSWNLDLFQINYLIVKLSVWSDSNFESDIFPREFLLAHSCGIDSHSVCGYHISGPGAFLLGKKPWHL